MSDPGPGGRWDIEVAELRARMVAMVGELAYLRAQIAVIRGILDKMTRLPNDEDTDREIAR